MKSLKNLTLSALLILGILNVNAMNTSLLSFEAERVTEGIEIKWETGSEENNSHFEIWKSYDLVDFESVATVEGAGTSNNFHDYYYMDENISRVVYYKLKEVNFDGRSADCEIVKVNYYVHECTFNAYPNPTSNGAFDIQVQGISDSESVSITLVNMQGSIILTETMISDSFGQLNKRIDLSGIKGTFTLIMSAQEQTIKRRVVSM